MNIHNHEKIKGNFKESKLVQLYILHCLIFEKEPTIVTEAFLAKRNDILSVLDGSSSHQNTDIQNELWTAFQSIDIHGLEEEIYKYLHGWVSEVNRLTESNRNQLLKSILLNIDKALLIDSVAQYCNTEDVLRSMLKNIEDMELFNKDTQELLNSLDKEGREVLRDKLNILAFNIESKSSDTVPNNFMESLCKRIIESNRSLFGFMENIEQQFRLKARVSVSDYIGLLFGNKGRITYYELFSSIIGDEKIQELIADSKNDLQKRNHQEAMNRTYTTLMNKVKPDISEVILAIKESIGIHSFREILRDCVPQSELDEVKKKVYKFNKEHDDKYHGYKPNDLESYNYIHKLFYNVLCKDNIFLKKISEYIEKTHYENENLKAFIQHENIQQAIITITEDRKKAICMEHIIEDKCLRKEGSYIEIYYEVFGIDLLNTRKGDLLSTKEGRVGLTAIVHHLKSIINTTGTHGNDEAKNYQMMFLYDYIEYIMPKYYEKIEFRNKILYFLKKIKQTFVRYNKVQMNSRDNEIIENLEYQDSKVVYDLLREIGESMGIQNQPDIETSKLSQIHSDIIAFLVIALEANIHEDTTGYSVNKMIIGKGARLYHVLKCKKSPNTFRIDGEVVDDCKLVIELLNYIDYYDCYVKPKQG